MTGERIRSYIRVSVVPVCIILTIIYINNPYPGNGYHPYTQRISKGISEIVLRVCSTKERDILMENSSDQNILLPDRHIHRFVVHGAIFNKNGIYKNISSNIQTSLIHSFSPDVERNAASKFVDPPHDNSFLANSPAFIFDKGKVLTVLRIWIQREKYERTKQFPVNHFPDNHLFSQTYDRHFRPLDEGEILGIPTPKQFSLGDGPLEPRIIKFGSKILITFNVGMGIDHTTLVDNTIWFDYERKRPVIPKIKGYSSPRSRKDQGIPRDKHWSAFINNGLYFVHNIDPLRILKCSINGSCIFSKREAPFEPFNDRKYHLRGGTPFEPYSGPYYVGLGHSVLFKKHFKYQRYYSAHLLVLNVETNRFVYCSDSIEVNPLIFTDAPIVRGGHIKENFIFPVGIIIENEDSVTIGAHVNDFSSVAIRIRGIRALMKAVIEEDKKNLLGEGPPPFALQNYILGAEQGKTKMIFSTGV